MWQQVVGLERWFGYGRWDAPYWFVGIEPGGTDVEAPVEAWNTLGGGELLDCRQHHLAFGFTRFHLPPYALQTTWRRLMLLLLTFKGEDSSPLALKRYQAEHWGSKNGETCAIEVSPVACRKQSQNVQTSAYTAKRVAHVANKIAKHQPVFVVLYSTGKKMLPTWERLAGGTFDASRIRRLGRSVLMVTPQPAAWQYKDDEWRSFAVKLRQYVGHGNRT